MKKTISTNEAPAAIGPYSQAVEAGGFVYISGQIPLIPGTGRIIDGDIQAQTRQVLENIGAILRASELDYQDVVKCTVYLADINDFKAMNEIYGSYFNSQPPARAAIQVGKLPMGALVEIDTIAAR